MEAFFWDRCYLFLYCNFVGCFCIMKTYAVYNEKGGAGKTTTALAMLSYFKSPESFIKGVEKKAVAVDMDPQRTLTFLANVKADKSIYDVLTDDADVNEVVINTDFGYIIPGSAELAWLDPQMAVEGAENAAQLKEFKENLSILRNKLKALRGFDYVILDCPPGYAHIALACMVAADELVVPAKASKASLFALSAISSKLELAKQYNKNLTVAGVLLTQHNDRTNAGRYGKDAAASMAKNNFNAKVFNSTIRTSTAIEDCYFSGIPIFGLPSGTPVRVDYLEFMEELLKGDK